MYDDRDSPALTPELAQQIAIDIGRITGFNVLITDQQAVVIGCGDQSRIDTLQARAAELGLTRALARTAVVLDVRAGQDGTAAVFRISLLRTVREFFGGRQA